MADVPQPGLAPQGEGPVREDGSVVQPAPAGKKKTIVESSARGKRLIFAFVMSMPFDVD